MRRPLRLAMVVVGLAAVVYGAASLTGGWLGTPPWWENCVRGSTLLGAGSHYDEALAEAEELLCQPRPGRQWISGGVAAVGLGLFAFGAWPRGLTLRMASTILGLSAAVCGAASLTGGWLGTPPWWEHLDDQWVQQTYRPSDYVGEFFLLKEENVYSEGPVTRVTYRRDPKSEDVVLTRYAAPAGRAWISIGVVAVGLGLIAVGVWPRRRFPAPTP